MGSTLLAAPWGSPFGWQEVSYRFDGQDGREFRSKTSLEPLVRVLRPVRVLVVVADTLGTAPPGGRVC